MLAFLLARRSYGHPQRRFMRARGGVERPLFTLLLLFFRGPGETRRQRLP